jgi:hypothetical protein
MGMVILYLTVLTMSFGLLSILLTPAALIPIGVIWSYFAVWMAVKYLQHLPGVEKL